MLIGVDGNAFPNDLATIVDGFGDSQHFEVTRGKIAKQVKIEHLLIDKEKGVFGIVACGRGPDAHACLVGRLLATNSTGSARRSTESSKIGNGVAELRLSWAEESDGN
jgi:hypothetical protein